jgi:uncharacterized membrane protein YfcA
MVFLNYLSIVVSAFLLEVLDASFGMGYGTALTPMLLMMGFDPLQVVPAVLVSQLAGDFLVAFFHHRLKNVNLSIGSKNFRVACTLAILSSIGCIIGVVIAVSLPKLYLNLYIGTLVSVTGFLLLATNNENLRFSWNRLLFIGSLAAFNKGMSGGGYGPLVTGGQILTGVETKSAIGLTSLAEGITCVVAVLMYILVGKNVDWSLSILLSIGVALSAPVSAFIVRKIESIKLRSAIGIFTLLLGLSTILRTL